jgi:hypothetical protein
MSNTRHATLLCAVLLLQGCGLFKNNRESNLLNQIKMENFTAIQDTEQFNNTVESERLIVTGDSSGYDYSLEIWPKGAFSFSPEKGFVGEAEKLRLIGAGVQSSAMMLQENLEQNELGSKNLQLEKSSSQSARLEQNEKIAAPSLKLTIVLGLVFLVLATGWYLSRR